METWEEVKENLLNDPSLQRGTDQGLTNHGMWLVGLVDALIDGHKPTINLSEIAGIPGHISSECEIIDDRD